MQNTNKISLITAENLRQSIENNPELIVINVLSLADYQDCHIKGSININYDQLLEKTSSWDKEKDVVIYCAGSSCQKSQRAYLLLQDLGFVHLYEYQGGIREWLHKGYETTGECKFSYLHS
ncbi:rhodanese-like domain-containing protein [Candidatus Dependentiae bacterium]|nr:rhodanese-like domain-containing protein [Candidatus Dependentiae bacterium]